MNRLANETSSYLLQHQNNPVDWLPWSDEAWSKARRENKLVLISIGYSACHWCHVMEHEVFEDEKIAAYMNAHFVNIKVDREERPDVDQIYMHAVQLMTQRGGWPLNCFVLPNGKPFYGGTYFPKDQWLNVLEQLVHLQQNEQEKLKEYSDKLTEGIQSIELIELSEVVSFDIELLGRSIEQWSDQFDWREGGMNRAPKFPMPNNYQFIQNFAEFRSDKKLLEFVDLTLTKLARGGIYDQLGGGFFRYSVDAIWKVPHFEKMLYDNGQLLSLYAKGFSRTKNEEYLEVISETVLFLERELLDDSGGFYSALDADSENVEGKYYVWTKEEVQKHLKTDYSLAEAYFNLNEKGLWENDNYILLRDSFEQNEQIKSVKSKLLEIRERRIKPGLDDKILTSWNSIAISGLADTYIVTGGRKHLELATKCADCILNTLLADSGKLHHSFQKGIAKIDGFLEDYAFTASALAKLFEVTSNENYLAKAEDIVSYAFDHFFDKTNGLFNFTDNNSERLIARKQEISDNVIPASNSEMAHAILVCGKYLNNSTFKSTARQMLSNVWSYIPNYTSGYSNWALLGMKLCTSYKEVVVTGPNAVALAETIRLKADDFLVVLHCSKESELPIFKGRFSEKETLIFVCIDGTCEAPVSSIDEALKLI